MKSGTTGKVKGHIKRAKLPLGRAVFLLSIYFLVSSVGWMAALDPHTLISQYGHTAWRTQDGFS
ncbi:MAG TPA: hypothetical protein VJK27_06700, partial [Terriglobales bacterium]|nr:hypothetical protein [Terriglobales bacterium]